MEQPLENRIAEAFHKKDNASSYHKKDELWNKIVLLHSGKKRVAAFWRAAAVILALITFGGAFAAIAVFENREKKITEIEMKNKQLEIVIDSFQNRVPEKIIETEFVEKEKIVYRDVIKTATKDDNNIAERKVFEAEIIQLTNVLNNAKTELQETRDSLYNTVMVLENLRASESKKPEEPTKDFKLKTERAKDQMQNLKTEPSPKMKLQLLKIPNENMKYNSDASFLRK